MTLDERKKYFSHLYGPRNEIFLPGLRERIDFLSLGMCDLHQAIRKDYIDVFDIALARVVTRIFCIDDYFKDLPFVELLARKYPVNYCSYCQQYPCRCLERRPEAKLDQLYNDQLNWGMNDWQRHLNQVYGDNNMKKGIEYLQNRLFREIIELLGLQMSTQHINLTADKIKKMFALELADTFAWTIALANFLDIDLEKAVLNRYGENCWKCHNNPCICKHFSFELVNWEDYREKH